MSTLLTVAAIHWVAMVSPGPNVLLVAQTAMARSRRAALAAAAGVASGAALLATGAAVGLGVVTREVAWLGDALQLAGGAYLVVLGALTWRQAREAPPSPQADCAGPDDAWRFYRRGLLTNLSNPKAAVFFASILTAALGTTVPDWVRVAAVAVIAVDALLWHCLLALAFGRPGVRRGYGRAKPVVDRLVGAGLGLLGVRLAAATL
jgi:threonine efflux protein